MTKVNQILMGATFFCPPIVAGIIYQTVYQNVAYFLNWLAILIIPNISLSICTRLSKQQLYKLFCASLMSNSQTVRVHSLNYVFRINLNYNSNRWLLMVGFRQHRKTEENIY